MRSVKILSLALAAILVISVPGCRRHVVQETEAAVTTAEPGDPHRKNTETPKNADDAPQEKTKVYAVGSTTDDYILPDAQTHIYTKEELEGLSAKELRIARNEIYARHGRVFQNDDLKMHFTKKEWYQPSIEGNAFDHTVLSKTELDNLKAVKEAEERVGSITLACPKIGRDDFPKIDGSTATLPISQAIYRMATGASRQEAESQIKHDKTTQAYQNLMNNRGPSLVIAYAPGDTVKAEIEKEKNLIMKPIGRDALVFMANIENSVTSLTQKQIVDIYSGKIRNWKSLGGKNREIKAFQRPENSGSQNLMSTLVMKKNPMMDAPTNYMVAEMGELIDTLSSYDNSGDALGYSVYFYAKNMYQKPGLKFMAVDQVAPSNETIRNGSYPYISDFYAAIRGDEPKDSTAYQLFEWLTSEDGQALMNALGYVGVKPIEKALPNGFEKEEIYDADITIPFGTVILADGKALYGESGIAVFDSSMNLKKFIRYVNASKASFFIWEEARLLCLQDTLSGFYGLYSLKEDRWVCSPEYTEVFPTEDGYVLMQERWDGSAESQNGQATYDYADKSGTIIKKGLQSAEGLWGEEEPRFDYLEPEEFAKRYPKILEVHGAGVPDISLHPRFEDGEFLETIVKITRGNQNFLYDMGGNLILEFQTDRISSQEYGWSLVDLSSRRSYLCAYRQNPYEEQYFIFQDGILKKELKAGETEWIGMEDGFYWRSTGNYLYVYNFDDELCGKFLSGAYADD